MKIGVDIRCLSDGRRTGVEEYSINFLEKVFKEGAEHKYVLFLNSWKKISIDLSWAKKYKNVEIKKFNYPNKILNFFMWYFNWPKIDRLLGGVDIFFMPNMNFIALSNRVKLILTIHDLSFEYLPEFFSLKRRLWHIFINPKRLIRQAYKILAISNSTRDDLLILYGVNSARVEVIYNGISDEFRRVDRNDSKLLEIKNKYNLPFNFVLFLGTFEPRKNIIGLIKGYEILREQGGDNLKKYKLVIAGSSGWKSKEIEKSIMNSAYRDDIFWIKFIENEDKVYVYNLCSLFIYPSFFEGFGIPPLEAMKCGVPVVTSNNSALVETVGEGGVTVDADRPDEIALAIREFLLNKDFGQAFANGRIRQVQKFSWTKSAKRFLGVIEGMSLKK